jgi:hypothetical protein
MGSRTFTQKQFLTVMQVSDVVKPPNHLEGLKGEENLSDFLDGYCQVGITSPPALMMLCVAAIAVTNSSMFFNFFEFTLF